MDDIIEKAIENLKQRDNQNALPEEIADRTCNKLKQLQINRKNYFVHHFGPQTKSLIAACLVIAAFAGVLFIFNNSFNGSVAWAEVRDSFEKINYLHFYSPKDKDTEAWYINGVVYLKQDNILAKDDGKVTVIYSTDGQHKITQRESEIKKASPNQETYIFDIVTQGIMGYNTAEITNQIPIYIGKDLLIYNFSAPANLRSWADTISIVVGKSSKLPVYIKLIKDDPAKIVDVYIFDYQQTALPDAIKNISQQKPLETQN